VRRQYANITVSIPAKVQARAAEDEWQNVDWVTFSTRELSVDGDGFLMIFKPSSGIRAANGSVEPKPLGNLLRACRTNADHACDKLMVTTSDSMYPMLRFTLSSLDDAQELLKLAMRAEAKLAASYVRVADDVSKDRGASLCELERGILETLKARCPLIFSGLDVYGSDPGGDDGNEVLLAHGCAVLLDPSSSGNVGKYELLFFSEDDGPRKPLESLAIAPSSTLRSVPAGAEGQVAFEFFPMGIGKKLVFAFDDAGRGAEFERDLRVRTNLMVLSSKTVKGRRAAANARSEFDQFRRNTLVARVLRFVRIALVMVLVAILARFGQLATTAHKAGQKLNWVGLTVSVAADVRGGLGIAQTAAVGVGSFVCSKTTDVVATNDLRACLYGDTLSEVEMMRCVQTLVPAKNVHP